VILGAAGLTVGQQTYQDLNAPDLDTLNLGGTGAAAEDAQLFSSSKNNSGYSINVYLVRKITGEGSSGGVVMGISGGIPGPAGLHGTPHSGIAMSAQAACFEQWGYNPGHTLAHEFGHYLGLSHNQEQLTVPGYDSEKSEVRCACPCGSNLTCVSQQGQSWCRGEDVLSDTTTSSDNLMYFAAESTELFEGNQLSQQQIRLLLDNPVVGH
jgi:hypothetical protein